MQLTIRKEDFSDYSKVFKLIESSFSNMEHSDHREQFLVERLRKSTAFIPELSLVAELDNEVVGHILLTKIKIVNDKNAYESLALAPISVHPNHQKKGIGGKLILRAHEIAKRLEYKSVVLLGHEDYYPKFGYKRADSFGIKFPFDAPLENCMAIELLKNGLSQVSGVVQYSEEFYQ